MPRISPTTESTPKSFTKTNGRDEFPDFKLGAVVLQTTARVAGVTFVIHGYNLSVELNE